MENAINKCEMNFFILKENFKLKNFRNIHFFEIKYNLSNPTVIYPITQIPVTIDPNCDYMDKSVELDSYQIIAT
jgi:hypothetical protein